MHYDPDIFLEQFSIVKRFVYHLYYYRTLHDIYKKHNIQSEFWAHTIDAHLLQATILWCMVFGSDGCNSTHWKNLSQINAEEIKQSFRAGLVSNVGIDMNMWNEYWQKMIDFRNEYAAHRDVNFNKAVPDFEVAHKIAHYYDDWIRNLIAQGYSQDQEQYIPPATLDEPSLKESEESLRKESSPMLNALIRNTNEYRRNDNLHPAP